MKLLFMLMFITLLFPIFASAIMDARNGNFSDTSVDLIVPSSGYDTQIKRSYNSRTLFNGIFGFGWCSELESIVEVTADENIRLTECGGGLELLFKPKGFTYKKTQKLISKIIVEVKKKNKALKADYYTELRSKLEYDSGLRAEFARQLGISGTLGKTQVFYADGRKDEKITVEGKFYVRVLPNGTREKYDVKSGRLALVYDQNGNYIRINHKGKKIDSLVDNRGNKLQFKYGNGGKVRSIVGPNSLSVTYKHKKEDLVLVENAWKNKYTYDYDGLHNLVRIGFPDKTSKLLTYNKDRDWVLSFTDRKGCKESYNYEVDPKDTLNHYTTYVEKKCKGKVTNISSYEFFYKTRKDGSRYLYRSRSDNNGDIIDSRYHEFFGKPKLTIRNNLRVAFEYYPPKHKLAGLLKKKIEQNQTFTFKYKNSCQKVSQVVAHYYQTTRLPANKKDSKKIGKLQKKLIKKVTSTFEYSAKCSLVLAKNSLGQAAKISHDQRGRIKTIKDQAQKSVHIKYEERFGKPSTVTRPGLGSIHISYKSDGSIDKVDSKQGPSVAVQVASIFNNLLEIISPLATDPNTV